MIRNSIFQLCPLDNLLDPSWLVERNIRKIRHLARELRREPEVKDRIDPEITGTVRSRTARLDKVGFPCKRDDVVLEERSPSADKTLTIRTGGKVHATNIRIDPLATNLEKFEQAVRPRVWMLEILTRAKENDRHGGRGF